MLQLQSQWQNSSEYVQVRIVNCYINLIKKFMIYWLNYCWHLDYSHILYDMFLIIIKGLARKCRPVKLLNCTKKWTFVIGNLRELNLFRVTHISVRLLNFLLIAWREMGDITEEIPSLVERLGRAVYVHVDLDSVVHNLRLMQECCKNRNIGDKQLIMIMMQFVCF